MALAAQLIFFIFPRWPSRSPASVAQAGPSPGRRLRSATEATADLPSRRCTMCRRRLPSRPRMELNRSAA
jgi:hypothetical protein